MTTTQAASYLGRFTLVRPLGDKLISGAYVGGHNEKGFVEGNLVIYHYDAEGSESSWFGRTYEYHPVAGQMIIDVISPANEEIFARLRLHPVRGGRLTGSLRQLIPPGPTQRITLGPVSARSSSADRKSEASEGEPSAAGTVVADPTRSASNSASTVVEVIHRIFPF